MLQLSQPQLDTLRTLQSAYPELPFVLIGAAALSAHIALGRLTADIDLVIVAPIPRLVHLLEALGWQRDPRALHRWRCVNGAIADVLPATDEVIGENVVVFEDGFTMNALGFDLVLRHAEVVPLAADLSVKVASLATIVILKIVAWLDRPGERMKDLEDLTRILEYSLADDDERRWASDHPVGASGLDHEAQSFFSVGVDVGRIAEPAHRAVVAHFLVMLRDEGTSPFARMLRASRNSTDEQGEHRFQRLIDAFEVGLEVTH